MMKTKKTDRSFKSFRLSKKLKFKTRLHVAEPRSTGNRSKNLFRLHRSHLDIPCGRYRYRCNRMVEKIKPC